MHILVKLIVDEMLGNIVRWLRIIGIDTFAASDLRKNPSEDIDTEILLFALEKNRVLITSDHNLAERAKRLGIKVITIENKAKDVCRTLRKILSQLNMLDIIKKGLMSRCPICNTILRKVNKDIIKDKIPKVVYKTKKDFWICEKCGKVYWIGSHFKNIKKVLDCVFQEKRSDS